MIHKSSNRTDPRAKVVGEAILSRLLTYHIISDNQELINEHTAISCRDQLGEDKHRKYLH